MRLWKAEILKLRKRRGLMFWTSALTVGSVAVAYGVLVALHASNAAKHGPAGGVENLRNVMWLLTSLGAVAAILIGTTAGSQDGSSGVFRDLVVTGRSRATLFRVRMPGALAVYAPMLATGFALAIGGAYAFAGSSASPTFHDVVHYGIATGARELVTLTVAVALGSMIPARIATGIQIAWGAIVAPLLIGISTLGAARDAIDTAAAGHFAADVVGRAGTVAMSNGTAILVLAVWIAVALRVGAWWTNRVDA